MIFHRARIKIPNDGSVVSINNCIIEQSECLKYLGVILDSKISWIPHIAYVKNKISKGIGIMYQARKYIDKKSLVNLYNSYIYPYLIYCIESWGNAPKCHPDLLFIIQKRIIRIITFAKYDAPSDIIFRHLNILPLYNLVQNRIALLMYKKVNGMLPEVMSELYTSNNEIHDHFTRQCNMFHTNKGNTNVYMRSFCNVSPRIWNAIQRKINVNVSIVVFKTFLKLYLQEHLLEINYSK